MGSSSDKHKSSHGSRSKQKESSRSSKASSSSTSGRGSELISFLFVVNEFIFDPESSERDQWHNFLPPRDAAGYTGEHIGTVFRYTNGTVSAAPEFEWVRIPGPDGVPPEGRIARKNPAFQPGFDPYDPFNRPYEGYLVAYDTQSVFACSPFTPIIVLEGDASVGSVLRRGCGCDHQYGDVSSWNLLHFAHPGNMRGISQATGLSQGYPFVAGKNPSWMPSLVPKTFGNNARDADGVPRSRGLGGSLSIVIALMAFHGRVGRASEVFENRWWHGGMWAGPDRAPRHYPAAEEVPRGFVVQVCLDMLDPGDLDAEVAEQFAQAQDAYEGQIAALEWGGVLVKERPAA